MKAWNLSENQNVEVHSLFNGAWKMTDTATLKTLADTTFDSVEGYRKAMAKAESPALKQALATRVAAREKTLDALNAELTRAGGQRVAEGTTAGAVHWLWLSITDAFENGDEAAAERVEEGEDYLKEKFEVALKQDDLDPQHRSVIERCFAEIAEGERFGDMIERRYD